MPPDDPIPGRSHRHARRGFLGRMAAGVLAPWVGATGGSAADPGADDIIARENSQLGALDWQLTRVRADREGFRSPWIEGYCSKQSVKAGETIDIMVSTRPA